MKLDEIWDWFWTKTKYAVADVWNFLLFKLAIWVLAGVIIAFLEIKEFLERRAKKWKFVCRHNRD